RDAAHLERHRRHRPLAPRDPRELRGRGSRRAARARRTATRREVGRQALWYKDPVSARARGVGVAVGLIALGAVAAASALRSTPTVPHLAQVRTLYVKDHAGKAPASESMLLTYSKTFEKVLDSCTITSGDLTDATLFWSRKISAMGGPPTTSLSILQAFGKRITWSAPRDCWNTFIAVEARVENAAASARMKFRHETTPLYVYDQNGASPKSDADLLAYSDPFAKIIDHCIVTPGDNANLMIHLSDQATEDGGRHATPLRWLRGIAGGMDGPPPKIICGDVFDNEGAHAEAGRP